MRQTVLCREREREREREGRGGGEEKVCGGTSCPKRPTVRNDWLQAHREGCGERGRGGSGAHLQWCVLYNCTDSAINHRDLEREGKLGGGKDGGIEERKR